MADNALDPVDADAVTQRHRAYVAARNTTKILRERLVNAELEEARAKSARDVLIASLAAKSGLVEAAVDLKFESSECLGDQCPTTTVRFVSKGA